MILFLAAFVVGGLFVRRRVLGGQSGQLLVGEGLLRLVLRLLHRLLVAASRKRFIASLLSPDDPKQAEQAAKDQATATISAISAQAGAWAVRVHDPATSAVACKVIAAVREHSAAANPAADFGPDGAGR